MLLTIIPNLTNDKRKPGGIKASKVTITANRIKPKARHKKFFFNTPVALNALLRKPIPLNKIIEKMKTIKK